MAVTPERKAELIAELEEIIGHRMDRPKVVASETEVVRDADVRVSRADPNYPKSQEGMIRVRRNDFVTIRMDLWEEQQRQKRGEKLHRRQLDPYRLGHWGPIDEDDE
jgi:hypothetical protein